MILKRIESKPELTCIVNSLRSSITELQQTNDMTFWVGHVTRRLGTSRSARSHALDNWKRRPPFLLSEGFSTRSQIASLMPLSRYRSSLSRITTSSVLKACPVSLRCIYTAEFCASLEQGLRCCLARALRDWQVSPM